MKALPLTLFAACAVTSLASQAAELDIKLTNLTQGLHFTPILITAHNSDSKLFSVAMPASTALQTMAEGGNLEPLMTEATAANSDMVANPAEGLLAPASSTMASLSTKDGNNYLSLTAMLLPTNDGFVGLDSWMIPSEAGTYTVYLNAYDAGTEENSEAMGSIPGPADSGEGFNAARDDVLNKVSRHPGLVTQADDSESVLMAEHRIAGQVGRLVITRTN